MNSGIQSRKKAIEPTQMIVAPLIPSDCEMGHNLIRRQLFLKYREARFSAFPRRPVAPRAGFQPAVPGHTGKSGREEGFIRRKRAPGLKKADMLIPLGVAFKGSKTGGQHVHELVVSRLRHSGLPVRPHRLPGRPGDLHHSSGAQDLPLPGLRLARRRVARRGRAPVPDRPHREPSDGRSPAHPPRRVPGLWRGAPGRGPLRRPEAELHQVLRAVRPGVVPADDHPRRGRAPERRLGRDQGHSEARPVAAVRQDQAQAPAADRRRRDRRRQGAPLPDDRHGPGERRGGVRRRRQGGRRAEAVLEAAAAQRGQDRSGGHGHVGGLPQRGLDSPAQGEDRSTGSTSSSSSTRSSPTSADRCTTRPTTPRRRS